MNKLSTSILICLVFAILFSFHTQEGFDINKSVINKWNKCSKSKICLINFSDETNFQWDTMYFFSSLNSLEDINKDLGFELTEFTDLGDRVIFLYKGHIVYYKEWFIDPRERIKSVIFQVQSNKFKTTNISAKFRISSKDRLLYLSPVI